jgi:hypothetical protein
MEWILIKGQAIHQPYQEQSIGFGSLYLIKVGLSPPKRLLPKLLTDPSKPYLVTDDLYANITIWCPSSKPVRDNNQLSSLMSI